MINDRLKTCDERDEWGGKRRGPGNAAAPRVEYSSVGEAKGDMARYRLSQHDNQHASSASTLDV